MFKDILCYPASLEPASVATSSSKHSLHFSFLFLFVWFGLGFGFSFFALVYLFVRLGQGRSACHSITVRAAYQSEFHVGPEIQLRYVKPGAKPLTFWTISISSCFLFLYRDLM